MSSPPVRSWPPLAAFAAARMVSAAVAWTSGFPPLDPQTWVRWDSVLYLRIAERGYQIERCRPETGLPAGNWCGTTGWFPAYPWLIALFTKLGGAPAWWGVLLALAAHCGLLWIVWRHLLGGQVTPRNLAVLVLAAFFPGAIYLQAVFPISLCLFLAAGCLVACARERFVLAAALGAAAAFTYTTGFLLGVAWAAWLLLGAQPRERDWHRLLPLLGIGAGFVAAVAVMAVQTGLPDAFFLTQAAYGYGPSDPLHTLFVRVAPLFSSARFAEKAAGFQSLLATALAALACAGAWQRRRDPFAFLLGAWAAAFWLFPLVLGGRISLYRAESLLLPSVALVREAPLPLLVLLAACAVAVSLPIALGFFRGILI